MTIKPNSKVMLAEDDETMVTVLQTLLEIEGFIVAVAPVQKGQAKVNLLDFIRKEQPDVMLLDYHLGETSGLDVLHQLREDPTTTRTRIIMTSGMDVQDKCLAAGADDFVLKPFMPDELIMKLRG
jgi:CheY-like chemotaxis protein